MIIPLIYSDKKFISAGDVITLTANTDHDIIWSFPNIDISKIEITDGVVSSNPISFKSLVNIDPLIINCTIVENEVQNSEHWTDSNLDGLADGWSGLPFGWQTNSIETGWKFTGKSQRVVQADNFTPRLYQSDITIDGGGYSADLKYRSTKDLEMKIGGHDYSLSATERDPVTIFPILHDAGVVNFTQDGGSNPQWILQDGTYEYDNEVNKVLQAGTSYLIVDDFTGVDITSISTGSVYVGDLSDIPKNISYIELLNTGVVGDLSELYTISEAVEITNANIYGDVASLSGVSLGINLGGCSGVTGQLLPLTASYEVILDGCAVSGYMSSETDCKHWSLDDTDLTIEDLNQCLIQLDDSGLENGYFKCYNNMPTVIDEDACIAMWGLIYKNWELIIHQACPGSGF